MVRQNLRMNCLFTTATITCLSAILVAQESSLPKPSPASQKYHQMRLMETLPSFGLAKVQKLVKGIKEDSGMNRRLPDSIYNALSIPEKFTYTMIHGEDYSQNCDVMPGIIDENKKVFSYIPGAFYDEAAWSERQRAFLKSNRSKVIGLIRATIQAKHHMGINLKQAVLEINGWELIPDLVKFYNVKKQDHDVLTLLMLLMKENSYQPFISSSTYKKFYGEDANFQAYVDANSANQKLTLSRAMAFYQSKKK